MNIFLLFLTTIFMVGYYVIYSPSQRLEHIETDNVIKTSDLKSVIECVIATQNAAMNSVSYNDPCVHRYRITSQYVCTNENYNVMACNGSAEPVFNYIITNSGVIDSQDYADMLKIIEKLYQDKGSIGIVFDTNTAHPFLMTADVSGQRELSDSITFAAGLEDGELVYVMQYQIPYIYEYPQIIGDKSTCPDETVPVYRYNRWLCIEKDPTIECPPNMEYDPETETCQEIPPYDPCASASVELNCGPDETIICYPDGSAECLAIGSFECPEGTEPVFDAEQNKIICVEQHTGNDADPCSGSQGQLQNVPRTKAGSTLRIPMVTCGPCLKATQICNAEIGQREFICLPDESKIGSKSCWPEVTEVEDCVGPNYGIFFGFNARSRTDTLKKNNGADLSLEEILKVMRENGDNDKHDLQFHCHKCDYGVNEVDSSTNIFVTCKPSS